jgi:hypothetical protein
MHEAELRKERSISILKLQNIPYIEWLPTIEDTKTSLPLNTEEVAYRAMALQVVAVKAEGLESNIVEKIINEYGLSSYFTKKERQFIYSQDIPETDRIQFLWRYEAYWVLLWALGFVEKLDYPDEICDVPLAVSFLADRSREQFLKEAKLRPQEEILDQADLIYRYHWAAVEARIKGKETPGNMDASILYERHYTLNWLIGSGQSEWDDVAIST